MHVGCQNEYAQRHRVPWQAETHVDYVSHSRRNDIGNLSNIQALFPSLGESILLCFERHVFGSRSDYGSVGETESVFRHYMLVPIVTYVQGIWRKRARDHRTQARPNRWLQADLLLACWPADRCNLQVAPGYYLRRQAGLAHGGTARSES
jgi:hypothetical protein